MDEKEVIRLYVEEFWTLRRVADYFGTNHHMIRRILQRNNIPISAKHRRAPMTQEHKDKIVESRRAKGYKAWNKGLKASQESRRKNMRGKLRTAIDLDKYPDLSKLMLLTRLSSKHKKYLGFDDETREAFLNKFYFDRAFNVIYDTWVKNGKDKWYYPSLDHINPKSNGGSFDLSNLQILTWFENRAKADMTMRQWQDFKKATNTTSDLFLEKLLGST